MCLSGRRKSQPWGEVVIPVPGAQGRSCPGEPCSAVKLALSTLRLRCLRPEMLGDLPGAHGVLEGEQSQVLEAQFRGFSSAGSSRPYKLCKSSEVGL